MSSEYDVVPRSGGLKLKKIDHTIKKKKKKKEENTHLDSLVSNSKSSRREGDEDLQDIEEAAIQAKIRERNALQYKTNAEIRMIQMQERMKEKRVMDKASKTHKMRVEDFNKALDNLTEHFDIPKVSWTK